MLTELLPTQPACLLCCRGPEWLPSYIVFLVHVTLLFWDPSLESLLNQWTDFAPSIWVTWGKLHYATCQVRAQAGAGYLPVPSSSADSCQSSSVVCPSGAGTVLSPTVTLLLLPSHHGTRFPSNAELPLVTRQRRKANSVSSYLGVSETSRFHTRVGSEFSVWLLLLFACFKGYAVCKQQRTPSLGSSMLPNATDCSKAQTLPGSLHPQARARSLFSTSQ